MLFSPYIIGLDIQEDSIQVVLFKKSGKHFELIALNSAKVGININQDYELVNFERLNSEIKNLLRNAVPKTIKSHYKVLCAIPESKTFLHIFNLPEKLSKHEIENAILFEAEKVIPLPIQELYYDYQIISENHGSKKVLFAGIQKKIADQFLYLLESCGMKPKHFALRNNATNEAFFSETQKEGTELICDLSLSTLALSVVSEKIGNEYELIHLNLKNNKNESEKEKNYKNAAAIINQFLTYFNKEKKISRVILCGSALEDKGLENFLQKNIKMPVILGDPWAQIKVKKTVVDALEKNHEVRAQKAISFATAVGLAIQASLPVVKLKRYINLIPSSIKEKSSYRKTAIISNFLAGAVTIFALANMFFFYLSWGNLYYSLKRYQGSSEAIVHTQESERYQELKKSIINFNTSTAALMEIEKNLFSAQYIFAELQKYITPQIKVTKVNFDKKSGIIKIDGIAGKREDILETKNLLKKFPLQINVQSPLSNLNEKENISFTITLTIDLKKVPTYGSTNETV